MVVLKQFLRGRADIGEFHLKAAVADGDIQIELIEEDLCLNCPVGELKVRDGFEEFVEGHLAFWITSLRAPQAAP